MFDAIKNLDPFKKKELKRLQDEIATTFEEYESSAKAVAEETISAVSKVHSIINVLNSERNFLRDEVYALHRFLSTFEDMGKKPSPFDFVMEQFLSGNDFDEHSVGKTLEEILDNAQADYSKLTAIVASGGAVAAGVGAFGVGTTKAALNVGTATALKAGMGVGVAGISAGALVVGGMALGPIGAVGGGLVARHKNKKAILNLTELLEKLRMDWAENIARLSSYRDFISHDAPRIADLYRACVSSVRDSIKYKIVPEIQAVRCFFMADAIKENIKYDEDVSNVRPNPVSMYKDTPYHNHYLFVKNSYDFYDTIQKIFTTPILSDVLNDTSVSDDVAKKLEDGINDIRKSLDAIEENMMFTEVK